MCGSCLGAFGLQNLRITCLCLVDWGYLSLCVCVCLFVWFSLCVSVCVCVCLRVPFSAWFKACWEKVQATMPGSWHDATWPLPFTPCFIFDMSPDWIDTIAALVAVEGMLDWRPATLV